MESDPTSHSISRAPALTMIGSRHWSPVTGHRTLVRAQALGFLHHLLPARKFSLDVRGELRG